MRRSIFVIASLFLIILSLNTLADPAIYAEGSAAQRLVVFEGFLRPT